ncbi:MAG: DEAD/DEAH box helicase family protein, partial [Euryarchaeota archaeon]|nr:DEAD/DEAH box helicase family protein [Euryarchaeota archaeon]
MTLKQQEINTTRTMLLLAKAHFWQSEAYNKWIGIEPTAWEYGLLIKRMTIQAITGSGKTYLAVMIAIEHLNKHPRSRVVVVVPTTSLLQQWLDILRGFNMGNVSAVGGGHRYDGVSPIVVSTQHSLKKLMGHSNLTKGDTLFVLDECHKMAAKATYKVLINMAP